MINHVEPYYGKNEIRAINKYLRNGGFMTEYKVTEKFEEMLADFLKVKYVSCVPNGTSALYLSLLASGIGKGDYVLVTDLTMIATANAVKMTGAEPILWDIESDNFCLDLLSVPKKVINKIKAVIYVDLNGRSGNMIDIKRFCRNNNLILIEDACQAFGSKNNSKYLGTFGRFGCFSLGFHKIITTGQGGFIVTHNKKDYETIERLKDFGRLKGGNDIHNYLGFNFKFTDLQATIGIEQLKTIDWRIKKKRQIYKWYWDENAPKDYVPWFIELFSDNRNEIADYLRNYKIETRPFYPPIHTQKIYKNGNYPVSTRISNVGLWLPSALNLTKSDVYQIRKTIIDYAYF